MLSIVVLNIHTAEEASALIKGSVQNLGNSLNGSV